MCSTNGGGCVRGEEKGRATIQESTRNTPRSSGYGIVSKGEICSFFSLTYYRCVALDMLDGVVSFVKYDIRILVYRVAD